MDRREMGLIVFMVFVSALLHGAAAQTGHVVGSSLGWQVPQADTNAYSSWAAKQTFIRGDTLLFNFTTGQHDVANVTKAVYDACTTSAASANAIKIGPANVTLASEGDHYFICTFGQHCRFGQRVKITVRSSAGTTPPTGGTTPPTGGTTTDNTTTTTTPPKSASSMTATSFSTIVASIAVAFLYY